MSNYVKDPTTGKIYKEEVIAPLTAVDPTHWLTDRQNLQNQIDSLLLEISSNIEEEADFFTQFPDKTTEGYVKPEVPTLNNPIA